MAVSPLCVGEPAERGWRMQSVVLCSNSTVALKAALDVEKKYSAKPSLGSSCQQSSTYLGEENEMLVIRL